LDSLWNEILVIVILIGFNAYFAAAEIAILSVKEVRIRQLAEEGNRAAKTVLKLTANSSRMLATIQIGITLAGFLASASAAVSISSVLGEYLITLPIPYISRVGTAVSLVMVTLVISYFTLVFGELAPKRMALQKAESIALRVARGVDLLARVAGPVTVVLTWSTNLVVRLVGGNPNDVKDEVTEEEIKAFVAEHGSLPAVEKEMIQSVFSFGAINVTEVMVPRIDIVALDMTDAIDTALSLFRESGFSRIPVYEEHIDSIVGVLHMKDLLFTRADDTPVSAVMRKPMIVPGQKSAINLLQEMRHDGVHMAIVTDEFGGTAGLVTMEDLVEVVIGDIRDEHDGEEEAAIIASSPNEYSIRGDVSIRTLNEDLALRLPDRADYDTLGGLVAFTLSRIPVEGDEISVGHVIIRVVTMNKLRVDRVVVYTSAAMAQTRPQTLDNSRSGF